MKVGRSWILTSVLPMVRHMTFGKWLKFLGIPFCYLSDGYKIVIKRFLTWCLQGLSKVLYVYLYHSTVAYCSYNLNLLSLRTELPAELTYDPDKNWLLQVKDA